MRLARQPTSQRVASLGGGGSPKSSSFHPRHFCADLILHTGKVTEATHPAWSTPWSPSPAAGGRLRDATAGLRREVGDLVEGLNVRRRALPDRIEKQQLR